MSLSQEEKVALKLRGIPISCRNCLYWDGPRTSPNHVCLKGHCNSDRLRFFMEKIKCPDFLISNEVLKHGDPLA